jgi:hypothetical protein
MYVGETDMEANLTLKMDESVIISAKKYAEQSQRSLSWLVEAYFRSLAEKAAPQKTFSPLVESLIGTVSQQRLNDLLKDDPRARWIVKRHD